MGSGIWSMHFIGMLAFRMPVSVSYDVPITGLSLLIAVAASGFALYVTSRGTLSLGRLLAGGSLLGFGIAAMHYTGMAAMRVLEPIHYDVVCCAIVRHRPRNVGHRTVECVPPAPGDDFHGLLEKSGQRRRYGRGICLMHYTGMAAAS